MSFAFRLMIDVMEVAVDQYFSNRVLQNLRIPQIIVRGSKRNSGLNI
jgi:hypothetical protein